MRANDHTKQEHNAKMDPEARQEYNEYDDYFLEDDYRSEEEEENIQLKKAHREELRILFLHSRIVMKSEVAPMASITSPSSNIFYS